MLNIDLLVNVTDFSKNFIKLLQFQQSYVNKTQTPNEFGVFMFDGLWMLKSAITEAVSRDKNYFMVAKN